MYFAYGESIQFFTYFHLGIITVYLKQEIGETMLITQQMVGCLLCNSFLPCVV